jgi:hypothetical protein
VKTRRTFVSYFHSSGALVIMVTRRRILEGASCTVAVKMRLSVRSTYRRQETLLSRCSVVFALCFQGPQAIQKCRAEVDSGTTSTTDGLSPGVTLNVIVAVRGMRKVIGCIFCRVAGAHWFWPRGTGHI